MAATNANNNTNTNNNNNNTSTTQQKSNPNIAGQAPMRKPFSNLRAVK
jgi:hypothetical protein